MFKGWFRKKGNKHVPPFWQEYESLFADTYSRNTPMEAVEFVIFDTETTGLDSRKDKLLSIGAVRLKNQQIEVDDSLDLLVYQPNLRGGREVEVHGILPGRSQQGISERIAIERFVAYAQDSVLVGHHVGFDVAMLNKSIQKITGKRLKNLTIDTLDLAMRVNPPGAFVRSGDYTLDHLCQLYHLPMSDRHTAAGDAFITALLLMKLLARLRKRGVEKLGDLLRRF